MKVLQLNVWHNKLLPRVVSLINEQQPDVVCLQEFIQADHPVLFHDFYFNGKQIITEGTPLQHMFFTPHVSTAVAGHQITQGNAIFSRMPFSATKQHYVVGKHEHDYATDPENKPRVHSLQTVRLEVKNVQVTIANHHGWWEQNSLGTKKSVETLQKVCDLLRAESGPLILCGDLNVSPESPAMRVFDGVLEDLTATHTLSSSLGTLHYVKDVAADHILISPEVNVQRFASTDALASDHQALFLECNFGT